MKTHDLTNAGRFLWGFVRNPRSVGSIIPSSRYLAQSVVQHVDDQARCVAELGPGTGPMTRALLARLPADATVLALEIDPTFCAVLLREFRDPRLRVIRAPAQHLPEHAQQLGYNGRVDAIVSGLPFANFPITLRYDIVRAAYHTLAPGGVFAGYGYAPFALPPVLRQVFGHCRTGFVWRNVPPAFTFRATKAGA